MSNQRHCNRDVYKSLFVLLIWMFRGIHLLIELLLNILLMCGNSLKAHNSHFILNHKKCGILQKNNMYFVFGTRSVLKCAVYSLSLT